MLVDLLRIRATVEPDAVAFVVAGGDSLSYRSWDRGSLALCRGLLDRGVLPGDRVVLCFDARHWNHFAITYAAVHKSGAVPVLLGPRAPHIALRRAVARSGACGVVTSSGPVHPGGLAETSAWWASPAELGDVDVGREAPPPEPGEAPRPAAGELAHISYRFSPLQAFRPMSHGTSEMLAAQAVVDDAMLGAEGAPFLHAFDPASEGGSRALWVPLGRRSGPVIVLPTFDDDPRALCARTALHATAGWSLTPATAEWLLDSGALEDHDLTSVVRLVLVEGPASMLRSRLTAALPRVSLVSMSPVAHPGPDDDADPAEAPHQLGDSPPVATVVPVAVSQEGMLWHEVFAPGSQNLPPLVRRYRGTLDVAALEAALVEIVCRHEPLRSTFEVRGGRPVQVVSPGGMHLEVVDLVGLAPGAQDLEVATLLAAAGRPFDLVEGPLFGAQLVRLGPDDHLVVLRVHHSVFDDWSVGVFRRELSALYRAFAAGEPSPLAHLALSFSQFSSAQHRRLAGPAGAAELAWWKQHLAGAPLSLQLPVDDPDRQEGAPQASAEPVSVDLSPELSAQLRALARRERTTLFMTLLAAFEVLVHRYTGQRQLLVASVVANRNRAELEALVGCFTKKVLVRLDGAGDPTFVELLPRVRTAVVAALAHQDLPFETVLQGSLGAAAAVHGLVPQAAVMFQGVTPHTEEVVLPGLRTSGYDTSATTTRTHFSAADEGGGQADAVAWGAGLYLGTFLILSVIEGVDGVSLAARGAFHGPSVQRLLATFATLLADVVDHPTRRISELRVVDEEARDQLVATTDAVPPSRAARAEQRFEDQVARAPSRVAIIEGGGHLTHAELDTRADALARRLRERGVGPGALVGVCTGCSTASVVAVLAVWKAGAGYVALDPLDDDGRIASVREASSLEVVVTDRRPGPALAGLTVVVVDGAAEAADETAVLPEAPTVASEPAGADAVALVVYGADSSASTQAMVIGHRGVVNLASGLEAVVLCPGDTSPPPTGLRVYLSAGPTDGAFLRQLVALLSGHTLHVAASAGEGPREVVSLVRGGDIDVIDCSPAALREAVAAGLAPALEARTADGPTPVVVVGSPAPIDHETWRVLRSLPAVRAHHLYGPPECSFGVAAAPVSVLDRRLTLGPLLGEAMAVVLDDRGALVAERVTGELYVGGAALAGQEPAPPGEVDGPFVEASVAGASPARLFRTGQLARRLPGGKIELLGSVDETVDLRGFGVDRSRIATALQSCPGVAQVDVVLGHDVDGEAQLIARVTPTEGAQAPTLARLQAQLWAQLPGYAWPSAVEVGGGPAPVDEESADARLLASSWAEVLGVEHLEANENYWQDFSFLEALTRARQAGVAVDDRDVTRNRVLAALGAAMAARRARARSVLK